VYTVDYFVLYGCGTDTVNTQLSRSAGASWKASARFIQQHDATVDTLAMGSRVSSIAVVQRFIIKLVAQGYERPPTRRLSTLHAYT